MVGATAALAGLVIVASSVNIARDHQVQHAHRATRRGDRGARARASSSPASGSFPTSSPLVRRRDRGRDPRGGGASRCTRTLTIVRDPAPEHVGRFVKSVLGFAPDRWRTSPARSPCSAGTRRAWSLARGAAASSRSSAAIVVSWVALVEVLALTPAVSPRATGGRSLAPACSRADGAARSRRASIRGSRAGSRSAGPSVISSPSTITPSTIATTGLT